MSLEEFKIPVEDIITDMKNLFDVEGNSHRRYSRPKPIKIYVRSCTEDSLLDIVFKTLGLEKPVGKNLTGSRKYGYDIPSSDYDYFIFAKPKEGGKFSNYYNSRQVFLFFTPDFDNVTLHTVAGAGCYLLEYLDNRTKHNINVLIYHNWDMFTEKLEADGIITKICMMCGFDPKLVILMHRHYLRTVGRKTTEGGLGKIHMLMLVMWDDGRLCHCIGNLDHDDSLETKLRQMCQDSDKWLISLVEKTESCPVPDISNSLLFDLCPKDNRVDTKAMHYAEILSFCNGLDRILSFSFRDTVVDFMFSDEVIFPSTGEKITQDVRNQKGHFINIGHVFLHLPIKVGKNLVHICLMVFQRQLVSFGVGNGKKEAEFECILSKRFCQERTAYYLPAPLDEEIDYLNEVALDGNSREWSTVLIVLFSKFRFDDREKKVALPLTAGYRKLLPLEVGVRFKLLLGFASVAVGIIINKALPTADPKRESIVTDSPVVSEG